MTQERFSIRDAVGKAARRHAGTLVAAAGLLLLGLLIGKGGSIEPAPAIAARTPLPEAVAISLDPTSPASSARELRLLILAVNQHREAIGCKPLIWDERLARLARHYSETMASEGFFGHYDPSGNSPFDRMRHAGIPFRAAGENLAIGQTKGIQVYGDWMNSPEHRKIIENCIYTHHGIGFYRNRWSYLFARY
jgi:uncharacterized protein YkwD